MYFLDKFVWMLLVTVVTTQALQIAGVVDPPKGLEDISYNEVGKASLFRLCSFKIQSTKYFATIVQENIQNIRKRKQFLFNVNIHVQQEKLVAQ